jgi:hypothetical protein
VPGQPLFRRTAQLRELIQSFIHWTVRTLEIGSRFGLQVDWTVLGHLDQTDRGTDFLRMKSKLTASVLHQQERFRVRFNRSTVAATSVTRLGVFWIFLRRKSRNERRTQELLRDTHRKLDETIRSFPFDPHIPRPVDWTTITSLLQNAQTAAFTTIGTLGHMKIGVLSEREKIPWPEEVLKSLGPKRVDDLTR